MASTSLAPISVLLVEPRASERVSVGSYLTASCFHVTSADSFAVAKAALASHPPAILITELRLGEYNGLHLVLRGKAARPGMAAIVFSDQPDIVLEAEARNLGATFIVRPVTREDLLAAVLRLTLGGPGGPPITPPFERRRRARRVVGVTFSPDRRAAERRRDILSWSESTLWSDGYGEADPQPLLHVNEI